MFIKLKHVTDILNFKLTVQYINAYKSSLLLTFKERYKHAQISQSSGNKFSFFNGVGFFQHFIV
jgi:hypothetical protein